MPGFELIDKKELNEIKNIFNNGSVLFRHGFEGLRKNIYNLKEENKCSIIQENCFNYIKGLNSLDEKFDIIFIDTPYKEKNINDLIETIVDKKILKKKGIVIVHRHKKNTIKLDTRLIQYFLSYSDGHNSILDIARKCKVSQSKIIKVEKILKKKKLISYLE